MFYRYAIVVLALTSSVDAAIILNSQLRSSEYNGTIESTSASGAVDLGVDCSAEGDGVEIINDTRLFTHVFAGSMRGMICGPVAPRSGNATLEAAFTVIEDQLFWVNAQAFNGPFGGVASFIISNAITGFNIVAAVDPSMADQAAGIIDFVLIPAGDYTVKARVETMSIQNDEGMVFEPLGVLTFAIAPVNGIPEPSTALLLFPVLACLLRFRRR